MTGLSTANAGNQIVARDKTMLGWIEVAHANVSIGEGSVDALLSVDLLDSLPPRQRQTLRSLFRGHSEKQVARALGISQHTVHAYAKGLYRTFEVSSRAELMSKVIELASRHQTTPKPLHMSLSGNPIRRPRTKRAIAAISRT